MKTFVRLSSIALLASTSFAQYKIDPTSVSNTTRQYWCSEQQSQCPLICLQTSAASSTPESNTCDWQSLTFSCVCSNGLSPNISEYSQTLPYYICTEWGTQCVYNCGSDSSCAEACRANHPCGAQNPTLANATNATSTLSSSAAAATLTSTTALPAGASVDSAGQTVYNSLLGAAATPSASGGQGGMAPKTGAATAQIVRVWAMSVGQTFGSVAVAALVFGGAAVLL